MVRLHRRYDGGIHLFLSFKASWPHQRRDFRVGRHWLTVTTPGRGFHGWSPDLRWRLETLAGRVRLRWLMFRGAKLWYGRS